MRRTLLIAAVALWPALAAAQPSPEPLGIALEGYPYPHEVSFLPLEVEHHAVRMAYMDVPPVAAANGSTVLLLHGRNFPASYWQPTITALTRAGHRVVAPDQIHFGKSSKLDEAPVSFDAMAAHTATLLDRLGVAQVDVIAHSMGNMAAVRLARTYPDRVRKLVMYAPVGLEDYRFYVPPVPDQRLIAQEEALSADAYLRQLMTSYGLSLPETEVMPFVTLRERLKGSAEWPRWVRSFVASYQAIWSQPVVHELPLVRQPVRFIVGGRDRTAPGKGFAPEALQERMGRIAQLAHDLAPKMPDARVELFEDVGHLVHLEATDRFNDAVTGFFRR